MMQTDKLIYDVLLSDTLSDFFTKDETLAPLISVMAEELSENLNLSKKVNFLCRISELTENELDVLAADLNVKWYDPTASLEVKRRVIYESDYVHRHLASTGIVEKLLTSYFGNCTISEWFEYGGTSYNFMLCINDPSGFSMEKVNRVMRFGKKGTAKLEKTILCTDAKAPVNLTAVITRTRRSSFTMAPEWLIAANDIIITDDEGVVVTAY